MTPSHVRVSQHFTPPACAALTISCNPKINDNTFFMLSPFIVRNLLNHNLTFVKLIDFTYLLINFISRQLRIETQNEESYA